MDIIKPKYQIYPLKGVNEINLEMVRNEVINLMGEPESSYRQDFDFIPEKILQDSYDQSRLQLFYNQDLILEYIEVHGDMTDVLHKVFLNGLNVFKTRRADVLKFVTQTFDEEVDMLNPEYPNTCIFKKIETSFWTDLDMNLHSEHEDYERSLYFKTVGIGIKGYYSS